jgi:pyruvate,water dikinase
MAELEETAARGDQAAPLHALVAARRAAYVDQRGIIPPLAIGAVVEEPSSTAWSGRGVAASAGVTQGRARVLFDLKEADSFEPGEILVTVSTSPLWTALFGLASAVVTDSGGMLSHSSIVAREHGIPAVVGARGATQRIRTGDTLLVNGSAGTVTVLS